MNTSGLSVPRAPQGARQDWVSGMFGHSALARTSRDYLSCSDCLRRSTGRPENDGRNVATVVVIGIFVMKRGGRRTPGSSTTWPVSAQSRVSAAGGFTSTAHTAGPAFSPARCGRSTTGWSRRTRPSSTRTSGCSRRSTAALLYRDPQLARATHTQDASYLDVIHTSEGEWNPSDYAYQLTRRARGLPLWFSLAVFELEAYRQAIEVAASLPADRACRRCLMVLTTDDDGRGGSCLLQCLAGNGSGCAPGGFVKQPGS